MEDYEIVKRTLIIKFKEWKLSGDEDETWFGLSYDSVIAWLEKQGESKPIGKLQLSEELYEHIRNTCACIDDALSSETLADINDFLSMAERSAQSAFDMIEKQREKNTADKVEPKFKVGDWVVLNENHNSTYQVEKIENYHYVLRHILGGTFHMPFGLEYSMRLWTIKDAKDGDVLCSGQIILLFKKWEDTIWTFVIAYAGIDVSGELQITNGHWLISKHARPATQQYRELLFRKMKEAGYEWDAEKKQVIKL